MGKTRPDTMGMQPSRPIIPCAVFPKEEQQHLPCATHQVGSARSTLGVTTAFRSAKGSFSSSSNPSSPSESSLSLAGAFPCGDNCDCGLDMADGLGGAAGRGGGGGEAGVMLRLAISPLGKDGEVGERDLSVITTFKKRTVLAESVRRQGGRR